MDKQEEEFALIETGEQISDTPPQRIMRLDASSRRYAAAAHAKNTRRAYKSDWRHFSQWCQRNGARVLPAVASVVRLYITELADDDYATSTISRRLTSIRKAHEAHDLPDPTVSPEVQRTWTGIRRILGTTPEQKAALMLEDVRAMSRALPNDIKGKRDRALLLIGWVGAFRRSELVSLNVEDFEFHNSYAIVSLRSSKSDQESRGCYKKLTAGSALITCPVRSLKEWLSQAAISSGPVYRPVGRWGHVRDRPLSDRAVADVVKAAAERVGIAPEAVSGHSLRRGHVTQASRNGARKATIRNQTGHASGQMIDLYTEKLAIASDSSADHLGH